MKIIRSAPWTTTLGEAARDGDRARLRVAVGRSRSECKSNRYLIYQYTKSLSIAAELGKLGVVVELIAAGANLDGIPYASPPLQSAARNGHARCVAALVRAGADASLVDDRLHAASVPAVDCAVRHDRRRVLPILLRAGASVVTSSAAPGTRTREFLDAVERAGGFDAYCAKHAQFWSALVARWLPAVPADLAPTVVAFWLPRGGS